jgi:hypothetical protein
MELKIFTESAALAGSAQNAGRISRMGSISPHLIYLVGGKPILLILLLLS